MLATMTGSDQRRDVAIVGAGIVGLACALAAARKGLRVVVLDRARQALGASVRNFGFVTVTGQDRDHIWMRARRSREVWADIAPQAGITIHSRGMWLIARRAEAVAVLESFMLTDMAAGCELVPSSAVAHRCPTLAHPGVSAMLWSPHELRVESREAIPQLTRWLHTHHGVEFRFETAVHAIDGHRVDTARGAIEASHIVVCPGDDLVTLYPERLTDAGISRCRLQMMRLESPGFRLPGTLMSDLSLARYGGFAKLPEADALRTRLAQEQRPYLDQGIHLIVAQGADGSLVVGDSHHYDTADLPFNEESVSRLLLEEFAAVTGRSAPAVRERWNGTYAVASDRAFLIESPAPHVRLVVVTSGIGASTGFALGQDVIDELCP